VSEELILRLDDIKQLYLLKNFTSGDANHEKVKILSDKQFEIIKKKFTSLLYSESSWGYFFSSKTDWGMIASGVFWDLLAVDVEK